MAQKGAREGASNARKSAEIVQLLCFDSLSTLFADAPLGAASSCFFFLRLI